ncbi:hypothetical protein B0H63DRAFT_83332 [Podospora didyma]|uniref:C2H2-type domain-containing protein n=1 Tax=Podospora didyma TaxID=330526 RepID=A0AAE0K035_9PEZI|nr:hypothetical protein B0H63DRAFT_83332 [Podospora didyma]
MDLRSVFWSIWTYTTTSCLSNCYNCVTHVPCFLTHDLLVIGVFAFVWATWTQLSVLLPKKPKDNIEKSNNFEVPLPPHPICETSPQQVTKQYPHEDPDGTIDGCNRLLVVGFSAEDGSPQAALCALSASGWQLRARAGRGCSPPLPSTTACASPGLGQPCSTFLVAAKHGRVPVLVLPLNSAICADYQNGCPGQQLPRGNGGSGPTAASRPAKAQSDGIPRRKRKEAASKRRPPKSGRSGKSLGNNSDDSGDGDDSANDDPADQEYPDGHSQFFACPFYKFNNARYHRCGGKLLRNINHVKQHLERAHALERTLYCPRCWCRFPPRSRAAWESHIRDNPSPRCRVTQYQPDDLRNAEMHLLETDRNASQEERWFQMWDNIFSGYERPSSAYIQYGVNEAAQLLRVELPGLLQQFFAAVSPDVAETFSIHVEQSLLRSYSSTVTRYRRYPAAAHQSLNASLIATGNQYTGSTPGQSQDSPAATSPSNMFLPSSHLQPRASSQYLLGGDPPSTLTALIDGLNPQYPLNIVHFPQTGAEQSQIAQHQLDLSGDFTPNNEGRGTRNLLSAYDDGQGLHNTPNIFLNPTVNPRDISILSPLDEHNDDNSQKIDNSEPSTSATN